jgi:uncharacterized membrane protein YesL
MNHAFRVLGRSLNDLFQAIGPLIVANLLWLALTLPLVTAPPALAGLYCFVDLVVRGEDPPLSRFFIGFRRYFVPSWALAALNLGLLAVLLVNFVFYLCQPSDWIQLVAIPMFYLLLLWLCVQTYLFPLLVGARVTGREGNGETTLNPWPLFKSAVRLTLAEPVYSLIVGLAVLAWLALNIALAGPILVLTMAGVAVIRTRATLTVLDREPEPLKPGWK